MRDGEEGVVVGLGARAARVGLRVDPYGRSEQHQGLVHDVAAEVVQQTADLLRGARLAPAALQLRAPALEAGLEALDLAEVVFGDEAAQGEEVVVPAAVLEDGEEGSAAVRQGGERAGLGGGRGDRLVHDHGDAGFEGGGGERDVRLVGGGDHDQVEVPGPQLVGGGGDVDVGELRAGLGLPGRVGGDDRVQGESVRGGHEGAWKTEPASP